MLYGRLDTLSTTTRQRLRDVLRDKEENPQELFERESYNALYTERLAKYIAAENGLCFGRIDTLEGDALYIGRLGIWDDDSDLDPLLLDWRARLARPFYLATPASPDGVARRRHIRTRGRTVRALNDEYLDPDAVKHFNLAESDIEASIGGVAGEEALLEAISAARTGHMTDIVSTIQSEQDGIIRSEHKGVLVVQGGPGTGKTAVALHRAAFLLYTFREQLERSGVLIIGPNETFLDYISHVLPSLGETGVVLSTIGDLYPGVNSHTHDSHSTAVVKGSLDMVAVLKEAVREWQTLPEEPLKVSFDTYTLQVDKKLALRARGRARSSRRPHNKARPIFISTCVDLLVEQYREAVSSGIRGGDSLLNPDDVSDIRDELAADPEVLGVLETLWPILTPQYVLTELFADSGRLLPAAGQLTPEQRAALERPRSAPFSDSDAPLLDELAELIGIENDGDDEEAQRQWEAKIAEAQEALDILTGSAPQDLEDDLDPEILMAYDLIDAETLAARQEHRQYRTTAERAAADRQWTYGHAIIDEAQELSDMAWRMLMRRVPNRWMTIVGDPAQTGSAAGSGSWKRALEPYVAQRWKLHELTVNYRTPAEIMAIAKDVLHSIDEDASAPRSIRESGYVPFAQRFDQARLVDGVNELVAAWLAERESGGTIAVLVPASLCASLSIHFADNAQVSVLEIVDAKGLEFDDVILVEPAEIVAESPRGMSDVYVAITRATQRLAVLHCADLPVGFESITNKH
ncbi:AAA family ATPase [Hoyosella rhizosphaerae]|nr:AAA family ATPase [Hoyosella rhizosphaerae]MBN4925510.1 AAA family ATPase [Hoyosella rhizosphaerae]